MPHGIRGTFPWVNKDAPLQQGSCVVSTRLLIPFSAGKIAGGPVQPHVLVRCVVIKHVVIVRLPTQVHNCLAQYLLVLVL